MTEQALQALLAEECGLVEAFVVLLKEQQTALRQGVPSALPALTEKYTDLVNRLRETEARRNTLLVALGFPEGKTGLQNWLEKQRRKGASALLEKLLKLAKEAQQLNQLNGKLINIHLQATNESLAVLTAQPQGNALYGPDGQNALLTKHRIIDSA